MKSEQLVLREISLPESLSAEPTLLVVDDEPSILSALRRVFRPQGFRVLIASSAAAALELARTETIDLVISDMRMPHMDGAQFLGRMRQEQPQAVRILLTGYADINATIAAINDGEVHRYIAKPWDDNDIVLIVKEALARRALEVQNRELTELTTRQNEELRQLNGGLEERVRNRTAEIEQINGMLNVAYEELRSNFTLSMKIFAGLMELRLSGLSGQSRRVSEWAQRVCVKLGLGERQSHDVFTAALLHDIGKIGFPDSMLGKPVSLMSPDEAQRYRKHPLNAEAALMSLVQLRPVTAIIRSQHERLDGNGFPDGLEGEEIVQGARILAPIIDYENLIAGALSERRFSPEDAAASIRRGAGTRYDNKVVDAFLEAVSEPSAHANNDCCIAAAELMPGMVLSRDLVSPQGALLLAAGYVFDTRVVAQVREYAQREGTKLTLYVHPEVSFLATPAPAGAPAT